MNGLKRLPVIGVITLLMVFLFQAWQGYSRYRDFSDYHQSMAQHSVVTVATEITNLIKNHHRLAQLYSIQYQQQLNELLDKPENKTTFTLLADSLRQFMPEYSSFALADDKGELNFSINDRGLGAPCQAQLLEFAHSPSNHQPPIKIHRNDQGSHFDIITPFTLLDRINTNGLLFISFNINRLNKIIKNGQITGHHLQLINADHVTVPLTVSKKTLISDTPLFSQVIKNSPWLLVDMPDSYFFEHEKTKILVEMLLIFIVFSAVAISLQLLSHRELRQTSEATLTIESIEQERDRIAMDLHDQVLGELTHRIRELDHCLSHCEQDNPFYQQVARLTRGLDAMSTGIRAIIDDLHPQALSILGLEATLNDALEKRLAINHQLTWKLQIDTPIDQQLSPNNQLNLYRILLELSQNIIRHAKASHFKITIKKTPADKIQVIISDDGIGFKSSDISANTHGIANISTRVRSMNADIHWQNEPNSKGTTVIINIP